MEKPLLKITFKEPLYIYQASYSMVLANFILTRSLERNKSSIEIKDYIIPQIFSFNMIKSIDFIQPNEL